MLTALIVMAVFAYVFVSCVVNQILKLENCTTRFRVFAVVAWPLICVYVVLWCFWRFFTNKPNE